MESKYKTLIPLIIIFFIVGVAVGYVAHKPKTIEIEKPVEKIIYQNNTVYVTVTPTPIVTATAAAIETPAISDFTVRNYDPSTDTPTKTIELTSNGANPSIVSVHPGDTVLIKITGYSLQSPLKLNLTSLNMSQERNLGTGGAVVVTFNTRGSYSLKASVLSADPTILPRTYGEGTITVY
jgi:plastocyanin